ncbi:MAG: universal stress protein [Halobacteria archaeon]|nr:universal stress protein [Halobacteria archaeon]
MKILLGVGGSEDSFSALHETLKRIQNTGDDLTIAVVENPSTRFTLDEVEERVYEALEEEGVEAEVRKLEGHPGSCLVEVAESEDFDEIVLGGGYQSPMGKIDIGQIAEFVLMNSHVSVKLVR